MTEPSKSGEYVVFNDLPTSSNPTASGSPIMTDRVTLEQVRDWHRIRELSFARQQSPQLSGEHKQMADALDAHIAAMGEPVAWMTKSGRVINTETRERVLANAELGGEYVVAAKAAESYKIPLYTAPPASGDWDKVRRVITSIDLRAETRLDLQCKEWFLKLAAALPENGK